MPVEFCSSFEVLSLGEEALADLHSSSTLKERYEIPDFVFHYSGPVEVAYSGVLGEVVGVDSGFEGQIEVTRLVVVHCKIALLWPVGDPRQNSS
jgi:hypothetical protein